MSQCLRRSRRLLRIKLAERNVKCIHQNTPTPSPSSERSSAEPSPERDVEPAAREQEAAEPSGRRVLSVWLRLWTNCLVSNPTLRHGGVLGMRGEAAEAAEASRMRIGVGVLQQR